MAPMASNNDSGCDVPTDSCAPSNCDSVDMQALRRLHGDFTPAEQEELEEWSGATCWAEILELNCDFLMGDSDFTPYYMGPIDDETKPLLSKLLCLHEYGFLTLQSQPSSSELHEGTNSQCANCMGFTSSRQRAFLTFMLPRGECPGEPLEAQSVKRCLDELVKDKHFYTSIASTQGACKRGSCPKELVIKSTFPEDWETHRYKTAATEPELELAEEKTRKAFEHDCTCTLEGLKSSGATFERMNPYLIHVLAKEWKQVDLPGLVGAAADRAGMGPVYSEMLDYGSDSMRDSDEGNTDGNVD